MLNAEFGMLNGRGSFKRQALLQGCPQQVAGFFFAAQQVEVADVLASGVYVPADFDTK